MFNGIIKYTGTIKKINKTKKNCYLEISTKMKLLKSEIGSSISCSGACLTIDNCRRNLICFYISKETLKRTTFKLHKKGDLINLEKSLKFGERISGHFVQGHVDTTATVNSILKIGKSLLIDFKLSKKYRKFIVQKGSITINGISFTIAKILKGGFQISVIPKTMQLTNLLHLRQSNLVNIEFDVLGKYINNYIK